MDALCSLSRFDCSLGRRLCPICGNGFVCVRCVCALKFRVSLKSLEGFVSHEIVLSGQPIVRTFHHKFLGVFS